MQKGCQGSSITFRKWFLPALFTAHVQFESVPNVFFLIPVYNEKENEQKLAFSQIHIETWLEKDIFQT